jgi:hypothetical protein
MLLRTAFLWLMIASLIAAALLGIVGILFDLAGWTWKLVGTSLLVGGFSMTSLACAVVLGRRRAIPMMWFGIGASLAALAIWLFEMWAEPQRFWGYEAEETIFRIGGTATLFAVWMAHAGLLTLLTIRRREFRAARLATHVLGSVLAALILRFLWNEPSGNAWEKSLSITSILVGCGTVVTPVLALIEFLQRRGRPESIGERVSVHVVCPRCGEAQPMRAGGAKCRRCGLKITIDLEEPRCDCGYLLYRLEADRCPECGRAVAPEDRWTTAREPEARIDRGIAISGGPAASGAP